MLASANVASTRAPEPVGRIRCKPPTFAEILEEQRNRPGLSNEQRLHIMAHTEHSRALTEKTPMADWAWNYLDQRASARGNSVRNAMRQIEARKNLTSAGHAELAKARRVGSAGHRDIPESHHGKWHEP